MDRMIGSGAGLANEPRVRPARTIPSAHSVAKRSGEILCEQDASLTRWLPAGVRQSLMRVLLAQYFAGTLRDRMRARNRPRRTNARLIREPAPTRSSDIPMLPETAYLKTLTYAVD